MNFEQEDLLSHLREIDQYDFEDFVAELWERYGWKTKVTPGSNDRGIDVIAEKDRPVKQKHLIQVKRWGSGNKVGGPKIQQYSSLLRRGDRIDAVVVVTTSSFSRQAKELAEDLNVKLVDGFDLYDIISEADAEDLVKDYTDFQRPSSEPKPKSTSDSDESSPPVDSETTLNSIFDRLETKLREYRASIEGHKYNTQEELELSFRDENEEIVEMLLHYSAVYHNAADFSIRVKQEEIPEQIIEEIRTVDGIDNVWLKGPNQVGLSSNEKGISPECHALSVLIAEYRPDFSEDNKLYFDGAVPEPVATSDNENDDSETHMSDCLETGTNNTQTNDGFEIERKFDNLR